MSTNSTMAAIAAAKTSAAAKLTAATAATTATATATTAGPNNNNTEALERQAEHERRRQHALRKQRYWLEQIRKQQVREGSPETEEEEGEEVVAKRMEMEAEKVERLCRELDSKPDWYELAFWM